jgi:murein DD-endopeptidase MepM/ murein hydrolase activator NlpD
MHTGVDWAAAVGTPIIAAGAGRVAYVGRMGYHGNTVILDHGRNWRTLYAHLSSFDVAEGDCVASGTVIGRVGATGLTSGPALHFEVQQNGWPLDPMAVPVNPKSTVH